MLITIDKSLDLPVYQQIREGVVAMIKAGSLRPGDKLPGTRELASRLGVSRKTVLQAYLELAADSWVESRPGSCTYVLDRTSETGQGQSFFGMQTTPASPTPELTLIPGQPDSEVPQMDWTPHKIDGQYFRMPPYHAKWRGEEEWINFSRAIPDARLFPFERIKKVSSQMLWDPKAYFFDYGHPQGYIPLLEYIETRLALEGFSKSLSDENDYFATSGFQVALNLLITLLVKPGGMVVVENPTFNAILNQLEARGIPHQGVPMEHDGMDLEYLERLLERENPSVIITIPTLHNPTGINMSGEKRLRLIELAQRFNVPIIEDYWSMLLGHEGRHEPSLKVLDHSGHVIQIGSFSKAFLPGARVAWVIMPREMGVSFAHTKRALDRSDSYFLQTLVHEFIKKGYMDLHCRKVDRIYRARRDLMDDVMRQHFPAEVTWKRLTGGFTYWVSLPEHTTSMQLLEESVKQGVEFAPGNYFYLGRRDSQDFRLAFSTLTQPQIRQGVKRLGGVIHKILDQSARSRRSVSGGSK